MMNLDRLPAWAWMWILAVSIFAACKWLTWREARAHGLGSPGRSLGYLLAWPGMDARAFLDPNVRPEKPAPHEWAAATAKTAAGAALLWGAARLPPGDLLPAWIGLTGLALLLHFGTFHLLSVAWRRAGVEARPIMDAPLLSDSLSDFWGGRWNRGFRDLARRFVFGPARSRLGPGGATLLVFFVSGLVHDLVISVPASGGYGLPTAYFLVQGLGALWERSDAGRRLGMGRGRGGRAFALLLVTLPAAGLFHPWFLRGVAVPFLRAMGAL